MMKRVLALIIALVLSLTMMSGCGKKGEVSQADTQPQEIVTLEGRYVFSVNGTSSLVMEYSGNEVKFLNESETHEDLNTTIFEGTYTCIDGVITICYASNGETYAKYDYNAKNDTIIASASGMVFAREAQGK